MKTSNKSTILDHLGMAVLWVFVALITLGLTGAFVGMFTGVDWVLAVSSNLLEVSAFVALGSAILVPILDVIDK